MNMHDSSIPNRTSGRNRYIRWFALAFPLFLGAPTARGADESLNEFKNRIEAEVNAIKQKYETKIQGLENRVETLESENARLKNHKSSSSSTASNQSPEVAALRQ